MDERERIKRSFKVISNGKVNSIEVSNQKQKASKIEKILNILEVTKVISIVGIFYFILVYSLL